MIDVHIIKSDRGYYDECIDSLKDEPIDIHILKHSEGNLGKLRTEGFLKGNNEYAAAIDDDDILVKGTFNRAIQSLSSGNFTAYYTNHHIMDANKNVYGKWFDGLAEPVGFAQCKQMHHVVVYKKSVIEPVLKYLYGAKTFDKRLLNLKAIHDGEVKGDDAFGLYWRIHDKQMHKTNHVETNPTEWKEKVAEYEKKILDRM